MFSGRKKRQSDSDSDSDPALAGPVERLPEAIT